VKVASADPARLRELLSAPGVEITGRAGSEELQVTGLTAREIGLKAAEHGIALFELSARSVSLEEAFMELTKDAVEYHGTTTGIDTTGIDTTGTGTPGTDSTRTDTPGRAA
jgi:ABC-2 type transport system ATP-binding protein